eukprot:Plantae.Rhodophyta-Rhodochaete_pulchella.ctg14305.p1 GENE.Plantae.Rhodophyta-Rhodochaete_pulchella.ctg14305~~Plantae.Rhodophyta-Rhodochaete_pulchella.ctg14305.p1  ORF type:complete len:528 (+),score=122.94 Plantae.Rhodophyta-Rhodochaete_pulchella.ctg14305:142-1725(+)
MATVVADQVKTNGDGAAAALKTFSGDEYLQQALSIVVLGASGDLARKKTYPSLFELFKMHFIPQHATIVGYARSKKTDAEFREHIRKAIAKAEDSPELVEEFLGICTYRAGGYDSDSDMARMIAELQEIEAAKKRERVNRLFYFAIPPTVFATIGGVIRRNAMVDEQKGWNRLILEKPFGKDLKSFEELDAQISSLFTEKQAYRLDHYLGKEAVQNLMILRFGNAIYEPLWNRHYVKSVSITFKEPFGTQGRGGYFDQFGIIRDVMQNHLLQILCLVAMEPPVQVQGLNASDLVRDEKVKVLRAMEPPRIEDCVFGQYVADDEGKNEGYQDDATVTKGSRTPTFATIIFYIRNTRWDGVPFIMKAGKALNERKVDIRVQFHSPPGAGMMFPDTKQSPLLHNELVIRMQPNEAIYVKTNMKTPGLDYTTIASELDLTYRERFNNLVMPEAYTRLIIEVLRGHQSAFVRNDELRAAWELFTPLLQEIENKAIDPIPYKYGTRGPKESDELIEKVGFTYHKGKYHWKAHM